MLFAPQIVEKLVVVGQDEYMYNSDKYLKKQKKNVKLKQALHNK